MSATLATYARELPELTSSVKLTTPASASREELVEVWKQWMQQAGMTAGIEFDSIVCCWQVWACKFCIRPMCCYKVQCTTQG